MIKMSLNKLLNKKKKIGSTNQNANFVEHSNIVTTELKNFGMNLKVFNSLRMKIIRVGEKIIEVFIDIPCNEIVV